MRNTLLIILTLGITLAGAGYVSPVPVGSPPPEGGYLGISGGYELFLTRAPLPGAVEIGDSDAPLYLVSAVEGPVRLPDVATVHGFLPDSSAVCRLTREELFRLCGDPNLYFRELLPVVRAPRSSPPDGILFTDPDLVEELVEEVDLASIMAYDEDLAAFRTRYATSGGNLQAQDYLAALLEEYGYDFFFERAFLGSLHRVAADGGLVAMTGGRSQVGGGCFFTDDGGANFRYFEPPREPYSPSWGGLDVFAPGTIHYASDRAYNRTTDGGDTWTETVLVDDELDRIIFMYFADESVGYVFTISGQVFRSSDGGSSWEPRGTVPSQVITAASPTGSPDTVVASPGAGRILRSADGGLTWELVYEDDLLDSCANFAFEDGERGLGVGGWVFATADAGETWERLYNPSLDQTLVSVSLMGPGEYLICGLWGGLWHTDDGGETWDDRSGGLDDMASLITDSVYDDGRFWLLTPDYPGYSDDGGYSFTWLPYWLPIGFQGLTMTNVIGERRGTTHPDEYVYATAHYDSTSGDSDPMELAPGADDNGSGSTALLELARVLAPYENQRTLRFAFFDAEEWGLLGSQYHVNRIASEGYDVVAALNLDMIVWSDDPEVQEDLEVVGLEEDEWLVDLMGEACDRYGDGLTWTKWLEDFGGSDQAAFWNAGYAALLGIEDLPITYPYYHSFQDDYPNIEDHFPFTRQVTRATAGALARLIGLVEPPGGEGPAGPYAYPNPFRGYEHGVVTFANLTPHTEISVFDAGGTRVFRTTATGPTYSWEVVNSSGLALASGIYLYLLKTPDGAATTGKLAVIR